MQPFNQIESSFVEIGEKRISCFSVDKNENIDPKTVQSFGDEWSKFDSFDNEEIENVGNEYFDIINERHISSNSYVLDLGCGTGRWTKYISSKVKFVESVDPSDAVFAAAKLLQNTPNTRISKASVDNIPFEDNTFDLAFSLGVLHHIPDTQKALCKVVEKVKPGGAVLIYLYYSLDNRGVVYKIIFQLSNFIRRLISSLPGWLKRPICDLIALFVYFPLVTLSALLKSIHPKGNLWKKIPLAYYVGKSFNIIRNDALDRFGTPLEQRFSKKEVEDMMHSAGLQNIVFSNNHPYWHAVGQKK